MVERETEREVEEEERVGNRREKVTLFRVYLSNHHILHSHSQITANKTKRSTIIWSVGNTAFIYNLKGNNIKKLNKASQQHQTQLINLVVP